ncbi:hypothetical protein KRR26_00035 [Corallococcus sp. M34]|uniref:hypothetical protein n=1 Tax=Citreicoccus inhibens TaxID=2849499 RepID=UPI001C234AF1|nr:hypothetical protein [Citreicoccus inhibens]MBU8893966.1 hypothetical protein [Citreicoccus inhibens]
MKMHWSLTALLLVAVGCGNVAQEEAVASPELATEEASLADRTCVNTLSCRAACTCVAGTCVPDDFGPPVSQAFCNVAPVRECSSGADCITGCNCVSGACVDSGFSPPANCLLAPADSYENDNTHTTASSYPGSPQLNHSFHRQGDVDWVIVFVPTTQVLNVETYNLRNGPAMKLEIYAYNYATRTLGALLGSTQDYICRLPVSSCFVYRVSANAQANNVYAIKVTDMRGLPSGSDWTPTPKYDLKMY